MTKKVLVINTSKKNSGAEFSLMTMLKQCAGPDLAFAVATPVNPLLEGMAGDKVTIRTFDIVNLIKPHGLANSLRTIKRLIRSFTALYSWARSEKIDVLYANNLKAALYGVFLKLFLFKKLVWHSRDSTANGFAFFVATAFSDRILCISTYIKNQVKWKKSKTRMTYPLVQWVNQKGITSTHDIRGSAGLPKETVLIALVAQIAPWKNHGLFLDIAKELRGKNAHFLIIGEALCAKDERYRQTLEERTLREGLTQNLSFLGFQSDIQKILSQVDILVHPVATEPFGRAMLEAQLAGIPVVSVKAGGAMEIIEDKLTGFLTDSLEIGQLTEKVALLIEDAGLRKRMGAAAQRMASEKFELEKQSDLLSHHLTQW